MKSVKYLPIGTICTLKKDDKKIMIVGYYSISYNGLLRIYDYCGVLYPEGLLLKNRIYSFNHNDISSIDFVGYVSDEYNRLNRKLLNNKENYKEEKEVKSDITYNFKFDANGVVIYDPFVGSNYGNNNNKEVEDLKNSVINPFQEKYNSTENTNKDYENWSIFKEE